MSRPPRFILVSPSQHVIIRDNNREPIFIPMRIINFI